MSLLSSTYEGLFFFDASLRLRDAPQSLSDTALVRLARWLISPRTPTASAGFAFSAAGRLHRARALLATVAEGLPAENLRDRTSWDWVQREWEWVADSAAVKQLLQQAAARIDPALNAQPLLAAIRLELLPVLHLKSVFATESPRPFSFHVEALHNWKASEAGHRLAHVYSLGLVISGAAGPDVPPEVDQQVATLLKGRSAGDAVGEALVRAYIRRMTALAEDFVQRKTSNWTQRLLDRIGNVAASGFPSLRLMGLQSQLYLVGSNDIMNKSPDQSGIAMRDLVQSVLYDPLNVTAMEQIREWRKVHEELVDKYRLKTGTEQSRRVELLGRALSAAEEFATQKEGLEIQQRRNAALPSELLVKLGLPNDQNSIDKLVALAEALNATPKKEWSAPELFMDVRTRTIERFPPASTLAWDRILTAMEKIAYPDPGVLVATLPEPDVIDSQTLDQLRSAHAAGAGKAKFHSGMMLTAWIFSRQNMLAKIAAMVALVFIIQGAVLWHSRSQKVAAIESNDAAYLQFAGSTGTSRENPPIGAAEEFLKHTQEANDPRRSLAADFITRARIDQLYLAAITAAKAADRQAAIDHGLKFLSTTGLDKNDPRAKQIISAIDNLVFEQVVDLNSQQKSDEAAKLITRYGSTAQFFEP